MQHGHEQAGLGVDRDADIHGRQDFDVIAIPAQFEPWMLLQGDGNELGEKVGIAGDLLRQSWQVP